MNHYSRMRETALIALIAIGGLSIEGCATAQSATNVAPAATSSAASEPATAAAPATASEPVTAAAPATSTAGSTVAPVTSPDQAAGAPADGATDAQGEVAQLQRLMSGNELSELRTAYNGTYGASLLLHGKDMTYYVVLFQQKNFWRVIKTTNEEQAETVYADFVRRSAQLADVEIQRTVLEAQKAYTEQLLANAQARANRLQADLDVAHQQQALAANRQKQARDEAASLQTQKRAAQEQLEAMQQEIRQLQHEAEQGLPSTHPQPRAHIRSHHRKH